MLKKVFYGICALIISVLIIISSFFSTITTEGKKVIKKAITEERYGDALAFYSICFDERPIYQFKNDETGFMLLVFPSLASKEVEIEGNKKVLIREKAFEFVIFNIDKYNYKAASKNTNHGAITLTFDGMTEKLVFPYVVFDDDEKIVSNNYEYYSAYAYIPLTVTESDLPEDYRDSDLTNIRLTDSHGANYVNRAFETPFSFDNDFHNEFTPFITEYNEFVIRTGGNFNEHQEEAELLLDKLDVLMENPSYRQAVGIDSIISLSAFKWKMFGVITACIVGSILLGVFIFLRKAPSFIPEKPSGPKSNTGIIEEGDKGSK